jgi:hypothetical protein
MDKLGLYQTGWGRLGRHRATVAVRALRVAARLRMTVGEGRPVEDG